MLKVLRVDDHPVFGPCAFVEALVPDVEAVRGAYAEESPGWPQLHFAVSKPTAEAVLTELIAQPEAVSGPLRRHGAAATRRRWTRALALPALAAVVLPFVPVPAWSWVVWAVGTACCMLLALDRSRSLGHRVADGWLVARAGSLNRSRDWYTSVLGLLVEIEFVEDGVIKGLALSDTTLA